jgi:hypothetical protein
MTATYPTRWESVVRGRFLTLLACDGSTTELTALLAEAQRVRGPDSSITLLIEAAIEQSQSHQRSLVDSVAAWDRLRQRAHACLAEDDRTLMMIRSHHLRFLRLCGRPADLNDVVSLRRDELTVRAAQLADDDNFVGIARADLAVALIDRARTFRRCAIPAADPDADLTEAENLIDEEIARRARLYSPASSVLQGARLIMSELLIALAERERERGFGFAQKSMTLNRDFVGYFWEQNGISSPEVLRSLAAQAQSLSLLNRHDEAARTARQAQRISRYITRNVDQGWAAFVLAVTVLPIDREAAKAAALDALVARENLFPEDSCRLIEVRRFLAAA